MRALPFREERKGDDTILSLMGVCRNKVKPSKETKDRVGLSKASETLGQRVALTIYGGAWRMFVAQNGTYLSAGDGPTYGDVYVCLCSPHYRVRVWICTR